jgi:hypothetical protein
MTETSVWIKKCSQIYIYIYFFNIVCVIYMIYDIWYMIYDVWCMMYDMWYMVYDVWYVMYGIWYMICDIWYVIYDICVRLFVHLCSYLILLVCLLIYLSFQRYIASG